MPKVIAREHETAELDAVYQSQIPELVALYGRRRVGKTFLVRNLFLDREDTVFLTMTGTKDASLAEQTQNLSEIIGDVFYGPNSRIEIQKTWRDAFRMLTERIRLSPQKKIVLFFDEFPWMAVRGSRLLQTLEFYWNHYWSQDPRIKLIICGSSSSWILKNIVNNRGGLYNRVTRTLHLEPYNLRQTKRYLESINVKLTYRDVADIYMVLGGIPFYLSKVTSGFSATQAIEHLAFQKNSFLLREFSNLYATLFGSGGAHVELARIISAHHYGIAQEELVKNAKRFSSGGRVVQWLLDLEQAGFIKRLTPFGRKRKGLFYIMSDEYSLFYFRWIEPLQKVILEDGVEGGYWEHQKNTPAVNAWAGYAFETICLKHIRQIRIALKLPRTAMAYTWRFIPPSGLNEDGAQIDLLFDRADNSITLCEVKYSRQHFIIDKNYAQKLQRQMRVFKEQTGTNKNLFMAFVTAEGLKKTMYSEELVTADVQLSDLFKDNDGR